MKTLSSSPSLIPWPSYRLLRATPAFQLFSHPAICNIPHPIHQQILKMYYSLDHVLLVPFYVLDQVAITVDRRSLFPPLLQSVFIPSSWVLCWGMSYRFSPLFKTTWQLPGWLRKKTHICEYVSGLVYVGLYTYREAISCALPHLALWPISKHAFCDSLLRHCLQNLGPEVEGP